MALCAFCYTDNMDGALYCSGCGASLSDGGAETDLPPAAPPIAPRTTGSHVFKNRTTGARRALSMKPTATFAGGAVLAGRYELLNPAGDGAYARVWRALDRKETSVVAVKILARVPGDEREAREARERFMHEARVGQRLKHPYIVRVLDVGQVEGTPFMVMEWMSGRSLKELLESKGTIPAAETLHLASQIVLALGYAHSESIQHRDIKPANILLSEDAQTAKLSDFGIAKALDEVGGGGPLTRPGTLVGTVEYMAPEYIDHNETSSATDIYSLGAVLYEMLSGKPPFSGRTPLELVRKHLTTAPVPPSEANPTTPIPPRLDSIVLRCLAKNPEERYRNADALAKDLATALDARPAAEAAHGATKNLVGKKIRDYEIVALLGKGGMASVYKARHTRLGSFRALKVIDPEFARQHANFYERFQVEAQVAERLGHPSLAVLHDFSQTEDGTVYAVWEYVEGENLAERIRRGALPTEDAVEIALQVTGGLAAAHHAGIFHRDIAPDNILLLKTSDGSLRVKVIDFGIAKFAEGKATPKTDVGYFMGKVGYSAPEQLGNLQPGEVLDGRCDVFSTGVVLYEMLTGQHLFSAAAFFPYLKELATLNVDSLPFPIHVPEELRHIVRKAIQPDRAARHASIEALHEALRLFAERKTDEEVETAFGALDATRPSLSQAELAAAASVPPPNEGPVAAARPRPITQERISVPPQRVSGPSPAVPSPPTRSAVSGALQRAAFSPPVAKDVVKIDPTAISLSALLGNLFRKKLTGALYFSVGANRFDLYVHDGHAVNVSGDGATFVRNAQDIVSAFSYFRQNPELRCAFGKIDAAAFPHAFSLSLASLAWEAFAPEDAAPVLQHLRRLKVKPRLTMPLQELAKHLPLHSTHAHFLSLADAASIYKELLAAGQIPDHEAARLLACLIWMGALDTGGQDLEWVDTDVLAHAVEQQDFLSQEEEAQKQTIRAFCESLRTAASPADALDVSSTAIQAEVTSAYESLKKRFHRDNFSPRVRKTLSHELGMIEMRLSEAYLLMLNRGLMKQQSGEAPAGPEVDGETFDASKFQVRIGVTKSDKEKQIQQRADLAANYYKQALAAFKKEDYWQCIQMMQSAVQADPNRPEYHLLLGRAQAKNPKWVKQGVQSIEKAIQLHTLYEEARIELARVYADMGLKMKARNEIDALLKLIPKSTAAQALLKEIEKKK